MPVPSEKELLAHAVHFGHRKEKWNPKMSSYLFGVRKGVHIFDLTQTREHLEQVCAAMKKLQAEGKTILFVSTKQQSIPMIEKNRFVPWSANGDKEMDSGSAYKLAYDQAPLEILPRFTTLIPNR
jgi:hypothetical protein